MLSAPQCGGLCKGRSTTVQWRDIPLTPQSPGLFSAKVTHELLVLWGHTLSLASKTLNELQHKTKFAILLWSLLNTCVSLYPLIASCSPFVVGPVHTNLSVQASPSLLVPLLLGAWLMWVSLTELLYSSWMPFSLFFPGTLGGGGWHPPHPFTSFVWIS